MSVGHRVPLSYRFALRKIATWQVQRQYLHFSCRPTPPPRFGADIEGGTPVPSLISPPNLPGGLFMTGLWLKTMGLEITESTASSM